jgi:hypothetical protein
MSLTRRELLERAAATPLILGLSSLRAQAFQGKPSWFADALVRMRLQRACGVAILVPEDPDARQALARSLELIARARPWSSLNEHVTPFGTSTDRESGVDVVELLLEAVYCVVPKGVVPSRAGETAVLLDPDGNRVAGRAVDFSSDARFVEGMGGLLHGEGRLEARAAAARTEGLDSLLGRFAAKPVPERPDDRSFFEDRNRLVDSTEPWAPALALARKRSEDPRFRALLVEVYYQALARRLEERRASAPAYPDEVIPDSAGTPTLGTHHSQRLDGTLPYGVEWALEWIDRCPMCGMGNVAPRSRKFLRFLTE